RDCCLKRWMSQVLGTLQTEKWPPYRLPITQARPTRGSSLRDGHVRSAIRLATCPPIGETREKTSSHLRSPEDKRFHSTPARNAVDNVARVRGALLPSTALTSRGPQSGGAAAFACLTVIRGQHLAELVAGRREASSEFP